MTTVSTVQGSTLHARRDTLLLDVSLDYGFLGPGERVRTGRFRDIEPLDEVGQRTPTGRVVAACVD